MYNLKNKISVLGTVGAVALCAMSALPVCAAPTAKAVVEKEKVVEESATIETITAKQRKLVLAELNKKLRETNASPAKDVGMGQGAFPTFPSAAVPTPTPMPALKQVSAPIQAALPVALSVVSISGVGGNLVAVLSDGQTVKAGSTFQNARKTWTVDRVTPQAVLGKACDSDGKCDTHILSVRD